MNIGQIRQAIADACDTLDIEVSPLITLDIPAPCVMVAPEDIPDYGTDFTGGFTLPFVIWCFVPATDFAGGQDVLDAWLSDETAESIPGAIEADNTLGGAVSSCLVSSVTDYGIISTEDGRQFVQAKIHLEVLS